MRGAYCASAVLSAAATPFLANVILARSLRQEDYATFSLLYAFVGFAGAVAMAGQPTAFTAVFFATERRDFAVRRVRVEALRVIAGGLLVAALLWTAVWTLHVDAATPLLLFGGVLAVVAAKSFFEFFNTVATCLDLYRVYAGACAFSAAVMWIALLGMPAVTTYFLAGVVAYGTSAVYLHFRLRGAIEADQRMDYPVTAGKLLSLGWVAVPGMLVTSGLAFGERSLIGHFLTERDLATYALATTLAVSGARVVVSAILKSGVVSLLAALQAEDPAAARQQVRSMNGLLLCVLAGVAVAVWLGRPVFVAFFGERYSPTLPLLVPLFAVTVAEGLGSVLSQPIIQKGRLGTLVGIGVAATAFNLIANYVLIPHLGLRALVVSFAASATFSLLAIHRAARRCGSVLTFPGPAVALVGCIGVLGQAFA